MTLYADPTDIASITILENDARWINLAIQAHSAAFFAEGYYVSTVDVQSYWQALWPYLQQVELLLDNKRDLMLKMLTLLHEAVSKRNNLYASTHRALDLQLLDALQQSGINAADIQMVYDALYFTKHFVLCNERDGGGNLKDLRRFIRGQIAPYADNEAPMTPRLTIKMKVNFTLDQHKAIYAHMLTWALRRVALQDIPVITPPITMISPTIISVEPALAVPEVVIEPPAETNPVNVQDWHDATYVQGMITTALHTIDKDLLFTVKSNTQPALYQAVMQNYYTPTLLSELLADVDANIHFYKDVHWLFKEIVGVLTTAQIQDFMRDHFPLWFSPAMLERNVAHLNALSCLPDFAAAVDEYFTTASPEARESYLLWSVNREIGDDLLFMDLLRQFLPKRQQELPNDFKTLSTAEKIYCLLTTENIAALLNARLNDGYWVTLFDEILADEGSHTGCLIEVAIILGASFYQLANLMSCFRHSVETKQTETLFTLSRFDSFQYMLNYRFFFFVVNGIKYHPIIYLHLKERHDEVLTLYTMFPQQIVLNVDDLDTQQWCHLMSTLAREGKFTLLIYYIDLSFKDKNSILAHAAKGLIDFQMRPNLTGAELENALLYFDKILSFDPENIGAGLLSLLSKDLLSGRMSAASINLYKKCCEKIISQYHVSFAPTLVEQALRIGKYNIIRWLLKNNAAPPSLEFLKDNFDRLKPWKQNLVKNVYIAILQKCHPQVNLPDKAFDDLHLAIWLQQPLDQILALAKSLTTQQVIDIQFSWRKDRPLLTFLPQLLENGSGVNKVVAHSYQVRRENKRQRVEPSLASEKEYADLPKP